MKTLNLSQSIKINGGSLRGIIEHSKKEGYFGRPIGRLKVIDELREKYDTK
jgi:hypothetical protein